MKTKTKPEIELPPAAFSNVMNDTTPGFNYRNWRQSREWKIFVAGYNNAVRQANAKILAQYDMGQTAERLFGKPTP
jgi:hypothetical protein